MFNKVMGFFKKKDIKKEPEKKEEEEKKEVNKEKAKERLHMVLVQDRVNVSADFLEMMKEELVEVIKKYVDIDESEIEVKLTTQTKSDGTVGTPTLYANVPIIGVKDETRKFNKDLDKLKEESKTEDSKEETQTGKTKKTAERADEKQGKKKQ